MSSNPLSLRRAYWDQQLTGDSDRNFIWDGICNEFLIVKPDVKASPAYCKNHKSVLSGANKVKVESQIADEIRLKHYIPCTSRPIIVSALGALPKANSTELRLITLTGEGIAIGLNTNMIF